MAIHPCHIRPSPSRTRPRFVVAMWGRSRRLLTSLSESCAVSCCECFGDAFSVLVSAVSFAVRFSRHSVDLRVRCYDPCPTALLLLALQNPHDCDDGIPIPCRRPPTEQSVELAKIADRLHMTAVHA